MKKRMILFGLAIAMALGTAITAFAQNESLLPPACDYSHCPSGLWNCCTQGGVTLYKN